MFLITSKKDNSVLNCDTELEYMENGYPKLLNENIIFPVNFVNIFNIDKIPEEVITNLSKYCYTEENGFYENPNYEEPNKYGINNELLQQIQDDMLVDLINMGVL